MAKISEDEESSVTRGFDNSKEGQSGSEVLREGEASSFHKASGEDDRGQESIRSSEGMWAEVLSRGTQPDQCMLSRQSLSEGGRERLTRAGASARAFRKPKHTYVG